MKQELKPSWPDSQRAAGEQFKQAWEDFFSTTPIYAGSEQSPSAGAQPSKLADIRSRHESKLLQYPHVVGISEGIRTKRGKPTGEQCLVVFVDQKTPADQLNRDEILPTEIEGVPLDVVEVGRVEPMQT